MEHQAKSIRPFIGAKNFETSRSFYKDFGFEEVRLFPNMSLFKTDGLAFYLQDAYVKDWIDNTMLFLEVTDVDSFFSRLKDLQLPLKYDGVRLTPPRTFSWGKEGYLHDPSGILWHFGEFK